MNEENQDLSRENTPDFVLEQSETTERLGKNQSSSIQEASISIPHETERLSEEVYNLKGLFQQDIIQTSDPSTLLILVQAPLKNIAAFDENERSSTSEASNSCNVNLLPNQFQLHQPSSFPGNTPASIPELPGTVASFSEIQSASTSNASSSLSQQTDKSSVNVPLSQNQFQPHIQSPFSEETSTSCSEGRGSIKNFVERKLWASSSLPQQKSRIKAVKSLSDKKTPRKIYPRLAPKQSGTTATSASRPDESELWRNFPTLTSLLKYSPKRNIETSLQESGEPSSIEITSPSKKQVTWKRLSQRIRTLTSLAELTFASKSHETDIHVKQRTRNFSSPAGTTFVSEAQVTAKCPKHQTNPQSIPGETNIENIDTAMRIGNKNPEIADLASKDETTDFHHDQKELTETSKRTSSISHQQSSFSSEESSLEKSSSEHSSSINTDVDRLNKRLRFFNKFICVKCRVEFATRDELLRHEPVHFND